MTPNNKQRWMGGVVLLSGGALLAALLLQGDGKDALLAQNQANSASTTVTTPSDEPISEQDFNALDAGQATDNPFADSSSVTLRPLEMDVETEQKLLEEQRAARVKQVAEQEARTAEFLATQQAAEASAARRAAEEQAEQLARRQARQQAALDSADPPPPEIDDPTADASALQAQRRLEENARLEIRAREQAAKAATQQQQALQGAEAAKQRAEEAKQARLTFQAEQEQRDQTRAATEKAKRDEEKRLAEQRKKDEALAAQRQKEADEKRAKQEQEAAKKAEAEQRKAEEATKAVLEAADKRLEAERARGLLEGDEKPWMVQAGLAANATAAEAMVAKLKAQGYKVQTSQTNRGVRVLVGPEKGQAAAKALSAKINQDPRVNINGAWAIDWQPLAEAAGRQTATTTDTRNAARRAESEPKTQPKPTPPSADTTRAMLMVQVALAADGARADAIVAKLKASGYTAKTSQTSRGVRIMVGPAPDREAAKALLNKLNQDPKLGMNSAWIINWQPATP